MLRRAGRAAKSEAPAWGHSDLIQVKIKDLHPTQYSVGMREVRDLHYNSVIFFALILFSPGIRPGKRVWVLVIGLLVLFFTQVLTVLVQVKFFYALQLGEYGRIHYGPWERNTYAFLKQFFELIGRFAFPFATWMLFTYKETIGYLTETLSEEKPHKKRKK